MNRPFLTFCLCVCAGLCRAEVSSEEVDPFQEANGKTIMENVYQRHSQYPFVYEEQSMILIDRRGNRNTRKLRRYSRVEKAGAANFLLLFDSPGDVKGVALLARREPGGESSQSFYLPALSLDFLSNGAAGESHREEGFLGTDYSIENLIGEVIDEHQHIRRDDAVIEDVNYYVIDVFSLAVTTDSTVPMLRRHYILKDNMFISRTDHYDDLGKIKKRQTQHDLTNVHGNMWRANMLMMDDLVQEHRTIIKVDKRVFSADYVPMEVFSKAWITNNRPFIETTTAATISTETTKEVARQGSNLQGASL